jgi:hypothetical protein
MARSRRGSSNQLPTGLEERGRLKAELRTKDGSVIRGIDDPAGGTFDAAGDFDERLGGVAPYRLLQYVDRRGQYNTVLNCAQMDDLLSDIEIALGNSAHPLARRGLERLRSMAQRCRDDGGLYIWFTAKATVTTLADRDR